MKKGHHEFVNYRETHRKNLNSEMTIFQTTFLLEDLQNLPTLNVLRKILICDINLLCNNNRIKKKKKLTNIITSITLHLSYTFHYSVV